MHKSEEHQPAHATPSHGVQRMAILSGLGREGLLLSCSAYFFTLYLSGSVRNYVNPEFNWLVLVSAGLFLLLGLVAGGHSLRPRAAALRTVMRRRVGDCC